MCTCQFCGKQQDKCYKSLGRGICQCCLCKLTSMSREEIEDFSKELEAAELDELVGQSVLPTSYDGFSVNQF